MSIKYYVTGILNPRIDEVLGKNFRMNNNQKKYHTKNLYDDENYQRREITFLFELYPENFTKPIRLNDSKIVKKIKENIKFVTKINIIEGIDTYSQSHVSIHDYVDPFYVLFMTTDHGTMKNLKIKNDILNISTEKNIGTMCATEYDTFCFIENELARCFMRRSIGQ